MNAPDNKRTTQMCRYLVQSGIPTHAEPNSFEDVALHWINQLKSNRNQIHQSDLEIIENSGLTLAIFGNQNQNDLFKELIEIKKQLDDLLKLQTNISVTPIVQDAYQQMLSTIQFPNGTSPRIIMQWHRYSQNPSRLDEKVAQRLLSMPQGASRNDLHKFVGGSFNSDMLNVLIKRLKDKNQLFEVFHNDGGKKISRYFSSQQQQQTTPSHYINNPKITWAKPLFQTGQEGFINNMKESDLIGTLEWNLPHKTEIVGIETYGIYPSGAVKFFLRKKNLQGLYSWRFWRWNNSRDIRNIKLNPEFDILNNQPSP